MLSKRAATSILRYLVQGVGWELQVSLQAVPGTGGNGGTARDGSSEARGR